MSNEETPAPDVQSQPVVITEEEKQRRRDEADSLSRVVRITHPDVPGEVALAPRQAFNEYWEGKGWVLAEDQGAYQAPAVVGPEGAQPVTPPAAEGNSEPDTSSARRNR